MTDLMIEIIRPKATCPLCMETVSLIKDREAKAIIEVPMVEGDTLKQVSTIVVSRFYCPNCKKGYIDYLNGYLLPNLKYTARFLDFFCILKTILPLPILKKIITGLFETPDWSSKRITAYAKEHSLAHPLKDNLDHNLLWENISDIDFKYKRGQMMECTYELFIEICIKNFRKTFKMDEYKEYLTALKTNQLDIHNIRMDFYNTIILTIFSSANAAIEAERAKLIKQGIDPENIEAYYFKSKREKSSIRNHSLINDFNEEEALVELREGQLDRGTDWLQKYMAIRRLIVDAEEFPNSILNVDTENSEYKKEVWLDHFISEYIKDNAIIPDNEWKKIMSSEYRDLFINDTEFESEKEIIYEDKNKYTEEEILSFIVCNIMGFSDSLLMQLKDYISDYNFETYDYINCDNELLPEDISTDLSLSEAEVIDWFENNNSFSDYFIAKLHNILETFKH